MRPALKQDEQDHEEYRILIVTHFCLAQLVFADESHFNQLTLRRPYMWLLGGDCAYCSEFSAWGTKYSILPALSLNVILHLEVVKNAITGNDFH